jgi:hypothetical protein
MEENICHLKILAMYKTMCGENDELLVPPMQHGLDDSVTTHYFFHRTHNCAGACTARIDWRSSFAVRRDFELTHEVSGYISILHVFILTSLQLPFLRRILLLLDLCLKS